MTERDKEIKELEVFFNSVVLPTMPIKLNQAVTLNNVPKFVKENMEMLLKGGVGDVNLLPRLYDLRIIRQLLS